MFGKLVSVLRFDGDYPNFTWQVGTHVAADSESIMERGIVGRTEMPLSRIGNLFQQRTGNKTDRVVSGEGGINQDDAVIADHALHEAQAPH